MPFFFYTILSHLDDGANREVHGGGPDVALRPRHFRGRVDFPASQCALFVPDEADVLAPIDLHGVKQGVVGGDQRERDL
jgi:hypothetical protein